jgi:hypothetical protein
MVEEEEVYDVSGGRSSRAGPAPFLAPGLAEWESAEAYFYLEFLRFILSSGFPSR